MGKCETCVHWGAVDEWNGSDGYKNCNAVSTTENREFDKQWLENIARTTSYESSALLTKKDFGCILHEVNNGEQ